MFFMRFKNKVVFDTAGKGQEAVKMKLLRMFSTEKVKGSRNYLDSQKKYEVLRTALYFFIPLSLFAAGILQTQAGYLREAGKIDGFLAGILPASVGPAGNAEGFGLFWMGLKNPKSRVNLLSIVAVLGLLPASKSLVSAIMFLRSHSLKGEAADLVEEASGNLTTLYDCVFTSYKINFAVGHLAVRGGTVCGYSEKPDFDENAFYKHIGDLLKLDGHKDVTVKIFTDLGKYTERLRQMASLEERPEKTAAVTATLKSVCL